MKTVYLASLAALLVIACSIPSRGPDRVTDKGPQARTILNVSFGITQYLFRDYNATFTRHWADTRGEAVTVLQSYGPSGGQARAVTAGLEADVLTLALAFDVDYVAETTGLIGPDWEHRLPYDSSPFYSLVAFLVRRGNPKHIHDWADLAREGVTVVMPSPKVSGGARWNYLAAWGQVLLSGGDDREARAFVQSVLARTPLMDASSRASALTFARRGFGDVLVLWESEIDLLIREFRDEKFEAVFPGRTIKIEPRIVVVDAVVNRRGTRTVAEGYANYFFSPEGQALAALHHFRPQQPPPGVHPWWADRQAPNLFTIEEVFGSWRSAHDIHFRDGGVFDQIIAELAAGEGANR